MDDEDDDEDEDSDQEMLDSDEEMDDDDDAEVPTRGRALTKFDTRNIPRKGDKEDKEERDNGQDVQFADSDSDLGFDDEDDQEDMVNIDGRQKNEDDDDDELAGELRWKANLKEKASAMFNATRRVNLMSLIYDKTDISPEDIASGNYNQDDQENDDNDDEDEEFFTLKREAADEASETVDTSREQIKMDDLEIWGDDEVRMDS